MADSPKPLENDPIYNSDKIRITRTILEIKEKKYQIRHIETIDREENEPDISVPNNFIVIGILIVLLVFVYALPNRLTIVGFFLIFVGVISRNFLTSSYEIVILTASGQEIRHSSEDKAEIEAIQAALETAIDRLP